MKDHDAILPIAVRTYLDNLTLDAHDQRPKKVPPPELFEVHPDRIRNELLDRKLEKPEVDQLLAAVTSRLEMIEKVSADHRRQWNNVRADNPSMAAPPIMHNAPRHPRDFGEASPLATGLFYCGQDETFHRTQSCRTRAQVVEYVTRALANDPTRLAQVTDALVVDATEEEVERLAIRLQSNITDNTMRRRDMSCLFYDSKDRDHAKGSLRKLVGILKRAWGNQETAYRVIALYLDKGIKLLNREPARRPVRIPLLNERFVAAVEKAMSVLPANLVDLLNHEMPLLIAPTYAKDWVKIAHAASASVTNAVYFNLNGGAEETEDIRRQYGIDNVLRTILHELGHRVDANYALLHAPILVDTSEPAVAGASTTVTWGNIRGRKHFSDSTSFAELIRTAELPRWPWADNPYDDNVAETFAEYFSFYAFAPNFIKNDAHKEVYQWLKTHIFAEQEYRDMGE